MWDDANPRVVITTEDNAVLVYSKKDGLTVYPPSSPIDVSNYEVVTRDDDGVEAAFVLEAVSDDHAQAEAEAMLEGEIVSIRCLGFSHTMTPGLEPSSLLAWGGPPVGR